MASSFKSLNLFGSGPHRFSLGKQGELYLPAYVVGGSGSGTSLIGPLELDVIIVGRLVASPTPGTLIDLYGHTWTNMSFLTFQEMDRVDRGRVWSVAYKAIFRKIA